MCTNRAVSVVDALIPVEGLVEGPPVALGLHVPGLHLPLSEEVRHPLCYVVVVDHVSEVIESEILDACVIAVGEADHVGGAQVLVLSVVGRGHRLEPVADQMPVKFHQHTH